MNQLQPTGGWSAATQRIDDRRAAAETYRLARIASGEPQTSSAHLRDRVSSAVIHTRDRAGNALIALGERITVHPEVLKEV